MKIAIDLTPLYGRKATGVELYAIDLYRSLLKTNHTIIPIFHVENTIDRNENSIIIKKTKRLILENYSLTKAVQKSHADIALFPIFPPPINIYNKGIKIVPILHDLAFLNFRNTLNTAAKYYLTPKINISLKKSDSIITISETIKNSASHITKLPIYNCGENIAIEYQDAFNKANISFLQKWNLSVNKYIISVSTIEPRKNFKYLLKVIEPFLKANKMRLVLVGRKGWGKDKELQKLINDMGNLLIFTEYVSSECLMSLYHYAYAFALLSIDEGFGRTPFESLACGCKKIILSDIPIFRETFENKAYFLPLNEIENCQKLLLENNIPNIDNNINIPFNVIEKRLPDVLLKIMYSDEDLAK